MPVSRVVAPPTDVLTAPDLDYLGLARTYSEYNYLRRGLASWVKRLHFEQALDLTQNAFGRASVLDFGCADGFFLPSLSRWFRSVIGIDVRPDFTAIADRLIKTAALPNARVICSASSTLAELRDAVSAERPEIAFLLEVIEHVGPAGGDPEAVYAAKLSLLSDVFSLLARPARIVVSVPCMVGIPFLVQRAALAGLNLYREPLSWGEIARAGIYDVRGLECRWDGGHLGFSHVRFEEAVRRSGALEIERRRHIGFQVMYVLREIPTASGAARSAT